ncbi:hypothetical protein IAU59_003265 [Kwoniella sp. CBS 9459]
MIPTRLSSQQNPIQQRPPPPSASAAALSSKSANTRPDRRPLLPPAVARAARASAINGTIGGAGGAGGSAGSAASGTASVNAGARGGKSLFQSYLSLSANTRILFGVVIGIVGLAGMLVDRNVLQDDGASNGEQDGKGFEVRMVDRK